MRRLKTGVLVAGALAAVVLVVGAVSAGAESGPKCADITGERHNYNGTAPTYTFGMELLLAAPACKSVVYTVYIIVDSGTPIAVAQDVLLSQDGNPTFTRTVTDDDPNICVFATTASKGGHVHDTAPNADCLPIQAGVPGGPSGFE